MNTALRNIVICLFALSGFSSLVFQTIWVRVLSLGVGSTSASISMVLSIFFFGLAFGSFLVGRYIKKIGNPLFFYGILEGIVGLYAIGLIFILLNFHQILAFLPYMGTFSWIGVTAKYAAVAVLLVLPTMGMGASLPLLIRLFADQSGENKGKYISFLYGVNTLGAVGGAFFSSFVLIPAAGIIYTNLIAGLLNVGIFFVSLVLYKRGLGRPVQSGDAKVSSTAELDRPDEASTQISYRYTLLLICLLSGFASISAEVVWNKYLGIYFGTNIYGLGIVLSIFLLGIALGSCLLSYNFDRIKNKPRLHSHLVFLALALLLVTSSLLNYAPILSSIALFYLGGFLSLLTIKSLVAGAMILPATTVFGALFPLTIDLLSNKNTVSSQVTGVAYAINTVGAIAGSCLAGLVLVPMLGSSWTINISIFAMVFAFVMIQLFGPFSQRRKLISISVVLMFVAGTLSVRNINFINIIKSAYLQHGSQGVTLNDVMKYYAFEHEEFKLIVEGETAITSLSHDKQDGPVYKNIMRLKSNGLNESVYVMNNLRDIPKYEGLLGLLPYAFSRNPQKAFIVGYGGGYTVDFLTGLDIPEVYVAELESGVMDAAEFIYDGQNPILMRPNLKLKIEDARYVLSSKVNGKFDIIVSQPSHSWLSGVANLFTEEFFKIVQSNLTERGVYSQWLNLYNMDSEVLQSILKTFYSVFPYGHIFTDINDQELIMIGANHPLQMSQQKLDAMTANGILQKNLRQVPFSSSYDFLTNFAASREQIWQKVQSAQMNTDVNVYAEVRQSRLFYRDSYHIRPDEFLVNFFNGDLNPIVPTEKDASANFYYNMAKAYLAQKKEKKFQKILTLYGEKYGDQPTHADQLGYLSYLGHRYASALEYFKKAHHHKPNAYSMNRLVQVLVESDRPEEALSLAKEHKVQWSTLNECYRVKAQLDLSLSIQTNMNLFTNNIQKHVQDCGLLAYKVAGIYFVKNGNPKLGVQYLESFYDKSRKDLEALRYLGAAYYLIGDTERGLQFSNYIMKIETETISHHSYLADSLEKDGLTDDADQLRKLLAKSQSTQPKIE